MSELKKTRIYLMFPLNEGGTNGFFRLSPLPLPVVLTHGKER